MGGSNDQAHLEGYTLAVVHFEAGIPVSTHVIIPEKGFSAEHLDLQSIHYQGSGFWPHRPLDVTVSVEGWIYVSVGGGRILVLRPP